MDITDSTSTSSINRRDEDDHHDAAAQANLDAQTSAALTTYTHGQFRAGDDLSAAIRMFQGSQHDLPVDGRASPQTLERLEKRIAEMPTHDEHDVSAMKGLKNIAGHMSLVPSFPSQKEVVNIAHANLTAANALAHEATLVAARFQPKEAIASLKKTGDTYELTVGASGKFKDLGGGEAEKIKVTRVADGYTIEGGLEGSLLYKEGQATAGVKVTFHAKDLDEAIKLTHESAKLASDATTAGLFLQSAKGRRDISADVREAFEHATSITFTGAVGVELEGAVGAATGYRNSGFAAGGEIAAKQSVEIELKEGRPEKITIEREIEAKGNARVAAGGAKKQEGPEFKLVAQIASVGVTGSFEATAKVATTYTLPSSVNLDTLLTQPNVELNRVGRQLIDTRTTSATIKAEVGITANASAANFDRRLVATLTLAPSHGSDIDEQVKTALHGDVEGALQKESASGGSATLQIDVVSQKKSGGAFKLEIGGVGITPTVEAKTRNIVSTEYRHSGSPADVAADARDRAMNCVRPHGGSGPV